MGEDLSFNGKSFIVIQHITSHNGSDFFVNDSSSVPTALSVLN